MMINTLLFAAMLQVQPLIVCSTTNCSLEWDDGNVGVNTETLVYLSRTSAIVPGGTPTATVPVGQTSWAIVAPNGRWFAYGSNESGRFEVYVQSFPEVGRKWQISAKGGESPVWARNGRELFFRNGDKMMAVTVGPGPDFTTAKAEMLFEGKYVSEEDRPSYDVSPDGKRFVMLEEPDPPPAQIDVVLNWFEELKRLVPTEN